MKRTLFCLFVCLSLLLGLCACGGTAGEPASAAADPTAAPAESAKLADSAAFVDAYLNYQSIRDALTASVNDRVAASNAALAALFPDSYYMNSSYLLLVYAPFSTMWPGTIANAILADKWEGAAITSQNGVWCAEYPYIDRTGETDVHRTCRCTWEFDAGTSAFRVQAWLDGELVEFTEFVPQGNGQYLLYTASDKALVGYAGGEITSIVHTHLITEPALGTFPGDMRPASLEKDSFYPDDVVSSEWLVGDADAQYTLYTSDDGTLTYKGLVGQDLLDADGNKIGVSWSEIDPIVLN